MNATEHNALKAHFDAGIEDAILGRAYETSAAKARGVTPAMLQWYADGWAEGQRRKTLNAPRATTEPQVEDNEPCPYHARDCQ